MEKEAYSRSYKATNKRSKHTQEGIAASRSQHQCKCRANGNLGGQILTTVLQEQAKDLREENHERNRPEVEAEQVRDQYCQTHANDHAKNTLDTPGSRFANW